VTDYGSLEEGIEAAITAAAYSDALDHTVDAHDAIERLGRLTSGRWRAFGKELEKAEAELSKAVEQVSEELGRRADRLGLPTEALWEVGKSAGNLDNLREAALDELEEGDLGTRLLESEALFGCALIEDEEVPDRGRTLVFGWGDPLTPSVWAWEASWVQAEPVNGTVPPQDLDLAPMADLEVSEELLAAVREALDVDADDAARAILAAAEALTRAAIAEPEEDDEDDEEEDED
jgi:hypothetical protein